MPCHLVLIKAATHKPPTQQTGDLVHVRVGTWVPTQTELDCFKIITVPNMTRVLMNTWLREELRPTLFVIDRDFEDQTCGKGAWQNVADGKWYCIRKNPKYKLNFANMGPIVIGEIESGTLTRAQVKLRLSNHAENTFLRYPVNTNTEITY